jgi:hypothetical protein
MNAKQLNMSPVLFNEDGHTYTLHGHELSGVTPIIHWLFPETYKGIPASVLNNAADYGSMIHKKCELFDSTGFNADDPDVQAYKELMEQKGFKVLLSEYLVSDEEKIASAIDKVTDEFDLLDLKTTSKVHIPNVTMQLSIYAWLFEMQNPGVKAGELYCVWLPKPQYGQPDIIHLKRVSPEVCKEIVEIWANGGDLLNARTILASVGFEFERQRQAGDIPQNLTDYMDELIDIYQAKKQLEEREKVLKELFLSEMVKAGADKWNSDLIEISRKGAYERTSIDTTALKKQMPDVYESYKKVTKVAESISYKVL